MTGPGIAPFSMSAAGTLAYWPYAPGTAAVLRWFDCDGRSTAAVDVPARYAGFALSPDGRRLAFVRIDVKGRSDIWVRDLTRGIDSPLTSDGYSFTDGAEIFYVSREKQMVATSFKDGDVGTPRALFRIDSLIDPEDRGSFPGSYPYAVANGQRFLAAINARDPDAPPINIILNWPALLRR